MPHIVGSQLQIFSAYRSCPALAMLLQLQVAKTNYNRENLFQEPAVPCGGRAAMKLHASSQQIANSPNKPGCEVPAVKL